ncbi:MAG: single-stranded DNA-binding protein [Anaerolineales bacterium]
MFHTIIIAGNVGKDAEMRYTPSGQPVTSFSLASNRKYTNNAGQQIEETIWFRVTTWGKTAEVCNQYVKKGLKVLVEGSLKGDPNTGSPRIWTKQDGTPGASFEVTANVVRFLSSKGEGGQAPAAGEMGGGSFVGAPEDDIPF